ncbi:MAG: sulfite exporter TauE/SafE family protein, partial [Acidobacteria bacterium]|nr:sulfite exporter TauE/SafE family protein [Acidobacteriota bacterium]
MDAHVIYLIAITLAAAVVNGGLGYGFSSITVPLALLFLSNRVLNPALVLIEVALNAYVLFVNRDAIPAVWRRAAPIVMGLIPGVIAGTLIVSRVSPSWLKLWTYLVLLPLILVQAAGYRRPIRSERSIGLPFGLGLGVLYSVT